jgi:hypothetical protein
MSAVIMRERHKMMARTALALSLPGALLITGSLPVMAQEERRFDNDTATLYRGAGYGSTALTVRNDDPNLRLSWRVSSMRVRNSRWEVCEQAFYRGACRTIDRDTPLLSLRGMSVQSIRRITMPTPEQPILNPQPGNNETLRGNFAQFFVAPQVNGLRVRACNTGTATAACAERSADAFCRSSGWNGAAREHMESVGREVYLADVLCVRTGY